MKNLIILSNKIMKNDGHETAKIKLNDNPKINTIINSKKLKITITRFADDGSSGLWWSDGAGVLEVVGLACLVLSDLLRAGQQLLRPPGADVFESRRGGGVAAQPRKKLLLALRVKIACLQHRAVTTDASSRRESPQSHRASKGTSCSDAGSSSATL
jgi:hypothetical protein